MPTVMPASVLATYRPDLEALAGGAKNVALSADPNANSLNVTFTSAQDLNRAQTFLADSIRGVKMVYSGPATMPAAPELTAQDGAAWLGRLPGVMHDGDAADMIINEASPGQPREGVILTAGNPSGLRINDLINHTWPDNVEMTAGPEGA